MAGKKKDESVFVPQVFNHEQFGKIRVVIIDKKPWFVAVDVARALGHQNLREALEDHVDPEDKNTVMIRDDIPDNPNVIVINKSGVYALIVDSQLPQAKEFRHWVTNEVLANIRKTGSYRMTQLQYEFFYPSPEELERRRKITTLKGMIEDLEAHGLKWDWEPMPTIEMDENGVNHVVYNFELVIKHPEYRKLRKQYMERKKKEEQLSKSLSSQS